MGLPEVTVCIAARASAEDGLFDSKELERIEVTASMIQAGIDEYAIFDYADRGEWIVASIYRAMELERRRIAMSGQ